MIDRTESREGYSVGFAIRPYRNRFSRSSRLVGVFFGSPDDLRGWVKDRNRLAGQIAAGRFPNFPLTRNRSSHARLNRVWE